jgi:ubiquinone/menaquinone biosynthesis C-methylase UbiE
MKRLLQFTLATVSVGAVVSFFWRYGSRRYDLPCPSWLNILVENPYVDRAAGSAAVIERADVRPGMRVLDAGSGPGRITLPLAERVGPKGEVVAVDVQAAMLRRLEERAAEYGLSNIRTLHGAIDQAPLTPNSFDRAFLVTVLGEIPDQFAALHALHTALKPGGVLSITEVLPDPHYQTRRTIRRLAAEVGFAVDEVYGSIRAFTINLIKLV